MVRDQRESLSFEAALEAEPHRIKRDGRICGDIVESSRYARHIRVFREVFGVDRVLILMSEELAADPITVMRSVWHFLEVDEGHDGAGRSRGTTPAVMRSEGPLEYSGAAHADEGVRRKGASRGMAGQDCTERCATEYADRSREMSDMPQGRSSKWRSRRWRTFNANCLGRSDVPLSTSCAYRHSPPRRSWMSMACDEVSVNGSLLCNFQPEAAAFD